MEAKVNISNIFMKLKIVKQCIKSALSLEGFHSGVKWEPVASYFLCNGESCITVIFFDLPVC